MGWAECVNFKVALRQVKEGSSSVRLRSKGCHQPVVDST